MATGLGALDRDQIVVLPLKSSLRRSEQLAVGAAGLCLLRISMPGVFGRGATATVRLPNSPAMAFGELYEFLKVVLSFA
jgi:hypothetical protein